MGEGHHRNVHESRCTTVIPHHFRRFHPPRSALVGRMVRLTRMVQQDIAFPLVQGPMPAKGRPSRMRIGQGLTMPIGDHARIQGFGPIPDLRDRTVHTISGEDVSPETQAAHIQASQTGHRRLIAQNTVRVHAHHAIPVKCTGEGVPFSVRDGWTIQVDARRTVSCIDPPPRATGVNK